MPALQFSASERRGVRRPADSRAHHVGRRDEGRKAELEESPRLTPATIGVQRLQQLEIDAAAGRAGVEDEIGGREEGAQERAAEEGDEGDDEDEAERVCPDRPDGCG